MKPLTVESLTDLEKALCSLKIKDRDLAKIIEQEGLCRLKVEKKSPYLALLQAIAGQQLHANAAHAILNRLKQMNSGNFPDPAELLKFSQNQLRECGFSYRKIASLHALASATVNNIVPTYDEALSLSDEVLIDRLTTLPGVGKWTVEMFLIFTLGRMDVMPVDDFAIREGWRLCKNLVEQPKPKLLKQLTQQWSPYRTIGAWYLWRAVERLKAKEKQNPLTR